MQALKKEENIQTYTHTHTPQTHTHTHTCINVLLLWRKAFFLLLSKNAAAVAVAVAAVNILWLNIASSLLGLRLCFSAFSAPVSGSGSTRLLIALEKIVNCNMASLTHGEAATHGDKLH